MFRENISQRTSPLTSLAKRNRGFCTDWKNYMFERWYLLCCEESTRNIRLYVSYLCFKEDKCTEGTVHKPHEPYKLNVCLRLICALTRQCNHQYNSGFADAVKRCFLQAQRALAPARSPLPPHPFTQKLTDLPDGHKIFPSLLLYMHRWLQAKKKRQGLWLNRMRIGYPRCIMIRSWRCSGTPMVMLHRPSWEQSRLSTIVAFSQSLAIEQSSLQFPVSPNSELLQFLKRMSFTR